MSTEIRTQIRISHIQLWMNYMLFTRYVIISDFLFHYFQLHTRYSLIYVKPGSHLVSLKSHSNFWNLTWYRSTSNRNDEVRIFTFSWITFRLSKEIIWDHRLIVSHQLFRLFLKAKKHICYKLSFLKYNRWHRIVLYHLKIFPNSMVLSALA